MNSLVHIAPQLPPAIDGLGDYCWNLWRHWPSDARWQFLALHGVAKTREHWREVKIGGFSANADSLHRALETTGAQTVVLHYVGYGFQPKGIPVWLPGAFRRWRAGGTSRRLVTMFHEMYARSSPMRSPFWVAPFARKIIRDLVHLSDAWITSCDRYFNQLVNEFSASVDLGRIIPIGSNIPVGAVALDATRTAATFTHRKRKFVVFGLAGTRLWALQRHWKLLRALNQAGVIDSITLLGKQSGPEDERAMESFVTRIGAGIDWRKRFDLSSEEISRELLRHDFGLLANEPDILTKSGVFAALAGHGVIPIVSMPHRKALPELASAAVLINDDRILIPEMMGLLDDPARLQTLRNNVIALAARELAWPRIAQSWSEVLRKFETPPCDHVSAVNVAGMKEVEVLA